MILKKIITKKRLEDETKEHAETLTETILSRDDNFEPLKTKVGI